MTNWSGFLFLVLACTFVSTISSEENGNHLAVVHVLNALPKNSEPMRIECKSKDTHAQLGEQMLNVGDDYQWAVEEKTLYYCAVLWSRWFASWNAFQPSRDVSHGAVYWLVKDNGFFLSWDNSSWVRKETWQTE